MMKELIEHWLTGYKVCMIVSMKFLQSAHSLSALLLLRIECEMKYPWNMSLTQGVKRVPVKEQG